MKVTGKIIAISPAREGTSANGDWKSQDYVVEYSENSKYPRKMMFSVLGAEKIDRFNIQVGQCVDVLFEVDARQWNGRWFNDIKAYDVRPVIATQQTAEAQAQTMQQPQPQAAPQPQQPQQQDVFGGTQQDDVPF